MTEEVEGGIDKMCNYSIGIAWSNYERGKEEGRYKAIRIALKNGGSVELVAKLLGLEKDVVEKIAME